VSVTGAISSFATGTYTRTRYAAGTIADGVKTRGAGATATITASVQPLSGQDLQALPEGRRTDEVKAVFTTSELLTRDRLSIDGEVFEVDKVEPWPAFGLSYFRAVCSRRTK
jgi:hypothetical protein